MARAVASAKVTNCPERDTKDMVRDAIKNFLKSENKFTIAEPGADEMSFKRVAVRRQGADREPFSAVTFSKSHRQKNAKSLKAELRFLGFLP